MGESTALVPHDRAIARVMRLRPQSIADAEIIATRLAGCPLLPPEFRDPSSVFLMVLQADDLGLSVAQAIRGLHIIKGKPVIAANLLVALCQSSSVCEYFDCVESTDQVAVWETTRRGRPARQRKWTLEMAKRAQLLDKDSSNWQKYPAAMLKWRAASDLAREVYADLVFGFETKEEHGLMAAESVAVEMVETSPGQYTAPPPVATPYADQIRRVGGQLDQLDVWTIKIGDTKTIAELEALAGSMGALGLAEADMTKLRESYRQQRKLLTMIRDAPEKFGD